ncbi:hypothetical protein [Frigoriflavimonas asaccharolytica]|uniref:Uncharacterized protein n=1 Tax=Frigoriflavimonas asaccharolytica TaxID=2735899 RepID=A0A8J8G9W1_9FLAO|nr:hypothetical protein [Frigoriflavimonas asaccharolytica]NRS92234.1 hypothetical protein [Frigoriflavimonas asaccharolytica]
MIYTFNDEENFLISLMIMGAIFSIIAFIVVIVFTVLILGILFILAAVGAISSSILVGFHQKSLSAGFKTLFIIGCSFLTIVASLIFFILSNQIWPWTSNLIAIISGVIFGIGSGWIFGILIFKAFIATVKYIKVRFATTKEIETKEIL